MWDEEQGKGMGGSVAISDSKLTNGTGVKYRRGKSESTALRSICRIGSGDGDSTMGRVDGSETRLAVMGRKRRS